MKKKRTEQQQVLLILSEPKIEGKYIFWMENEMKWNKRKTNISITKC